jgi:ParB family chromosome partitioning protein
MAKRNRLTPSLGQIIGDSAPLAKRGAPSDTVDSKEQAHGMIKVAELESNPYQPRLEMDPDKLSELAQSIDANGLLQPIVIIRREGRAVILAGHRRVAAFKILGKDEIPYVLSEETSDENLAVGAIVENAIRAELAPVEYAISAKKILDKKIISSQNKLADRVGLSRGHFSKIMSVLKLPDELVDRIRHDNYTLVEVIAKLNKIPSENVERAYEEVREMGKNEALRYIDAHYLTKTPAKSERFARKTVKDKIRLDISTKDMDEATIRKIDMAIDKLIAEFK